MLDSCPDHIDYSQFKALPKCCKCQHFGTSYILHIERERHTIKQYGRATNISANVNTRQGVDCQKLHTNTSIALNVSLAK